MENEAYNWVLAGFVTGALIWLVIWVVFRE